MILDSPGTSPSVIAHAHGFSAAEVAELLPIFLDNLRADFSSAAAPAPELVPPAQQPGETPEEHADRYLRELAQNEHLDVVGYDTLGATGELDDDLDDLDGPELDSSAGLEDTDTDLDQDPTFLDATPQEPTPDEIDPFDGAEGGGQPAPDLHAADPGYELTEDDPFAASTPPEADTSGVPEEGDPGEPFAMS
jgi:hypothetical protein